MIETVNHRDVAVAEGIHYLLQAAYRVEADLIGIVQGDFPPLARTAAEISAADSEFHGWVERGEIIGVIELERAREPGDAAVIASLAVAPAAFRRGIGRALITQVLTLVEGEILVSTGAANLPAIRLYESLGFHRHRRYSTQQGVRLLELKLKR